MKKFLAILLASVMLLSMVACGEEPAPVEPEVNPEAPVEGEGEPAADKIKVGVCIYQFTDNFMTLYREELNNYMKEKGCELTIVDGKNDQETQTNQINSFIADKVDLLIVNPVQASTSDTIIGLAKEANIPLLLINREPEAGVIENSGYDMVSYVGADARQSGTFQGEIILETANQGDINGNGVIDYVMIMGDPENIDAQYRTEFSIKALTDAGLKVNKLVEQRGDWQQEKGQEIAATALTQFGKDIDVIFCNNDGMALGAFQAIQDAGRVVGEDIYLVGVDALPECVDMVKNGTMTGTVFNDHVGQSHKAADVALDMVNGVKPEARYVVDYVKVTE